MQNRIAAILLVASAATQAFVCIWIALLVPQFFRVAFGHKSMDEALASMPAVTRLVSEHSWLIAIGFALVCLTALAALRRCPEKTMPTLAIGLCAQGFVTWLAMFCFCFEGFIGPVRLSRGPEFDSSRFMGFAAGVFPVTFLLILSPMIAALWPRVISKSSH